MYKEKCTSCIDVYVEEIANYASSEVGLIVRPFWHVCRIIKLEHIVIFKKASSRILILDIGAELVNKCIPCLSTIVTSVFNNYLYS